MNHPAPQSEFGARPPIHFGHPDERIQLTQLILRLFERWGLDSATQLNLLGLSETSRAMLGKYRSGKAGISAQRDALDRAGYLLGIHESLRNLYPENPEIVYRWVSQPNKAFDQQAPLEIMRQEGLIGLARVHRYLDFLKSR